MIRKRCTKNNHRILNKEDKINKESTVQRKQLPTTFHNRKQLKGWAKIPIPKQKRGRRTRHKADLTH